MGNLRFHVWSGFLAIIWLCAACGNSPTGLAAAPEVGNPERINMPTAVPAPTTLSSAAGNLSLWVSPDIPQAARAQLRVPAGVEWVNQKGKASLWIDFVKDESQPAITEVSWVYALVVPFPTLVDDVSERILRDFWMGKGVGLFEGKALWMDMEAYAAIKSVWGAPAKDRVEIVSSDTLLEKAWVEKIAWAIVPFEKIEPRWKVLSIDQKNLFDRDLAIETYPLTFGLGLYDPSHSLTRDQIVNFGLPALNRDPQKMTVLALTGTTAMARTLAERMEEKGVDYPAEKIGSILRSADITHISNEVPFYEKCPPAVPLRKEMRFCSDPSYYGLLKNAGTDVVELTGNHVLDWGIEPFLYTLDLYDQNKMPYYGGGRTAAEGQKPLLVEDHGNKLAFIGCNAVDPESLLAAADRAGAAPCDLDQISEEITELKNKGYQVIMTFQHFELDDYKPQSGQRVDFQRIARAGATIVSGSQAHHPQGMTFIGKSFVHYGLGNLFFDQMMEGNKEAFIDRHIFYDGNYIGTQLISIVLEDYSQPRLMTTEERRQLLEDVFGVSNWQPE